MEAEGRETKEVGEKGEKRKVCGEEIRRKEKENEKTAKIGK